MPRVRISISSQGHTYNSRTYDLPVEPYAELLVGTAAHCQAVLPAMHELAPLQACIVCKPRGYVVVDVVADMAAQRGGYAPPPPHPLTPGCELRLGAVSYMLEMEGAPVSPYAQPMPPQMPMQPMPQPLQPRLQPMQPSVYGAQPPVQYVPVFVMGAPPQKRPPVRTSKFSRQEASLLLARFHRHKMHNAYLWNLLWAIFTFLFLLAAVCLFLRLFFPEYIKNDIRAKEAVGESLRDRFSR